MEDASQQAALGPDDLKDVRVAVIDDDRTMVESCANILRMEGYNVTVSTRGDEARDVLRKGTFDITLIDLYMTGISGMDLLEIGLDANPRMIPIIMTGNPSIASSLQAMDLGAFAYIPKPFTATQIKLSVGQAAHHVLVRRSLGDEHEEQRGSAAEHPDIIGESAALKRTLTLATRLARTDASVFISGESGTGKELIAQLIHERSPRAARPMLEVNCAALPETLLESEMFGHRKGAFTGAVQERQGLLEAADGGTLFLDEITEMSLAIQAKLLRVIQDGKVRRVGSSRVDATVDVRFIAATNQNPEEAVAEGRLRKDLYYRLRVVPIVMPPLRERSEDIPILAEHFLRIYWLKHQPRGAVMPRMTDEALRELQRRPWHGNVRELQNVIEHAVVLVEPGGEIVPEDLPAVGTGAVAAGASDSAMRASLINRRYHEARDQLTDRFERQYLLWVVEAAEGNMSEAARLAGVDRTTLYRLMEKHDLAVHREVRGTPDDTPDVQAMP